MNDHFAFDSGCGKKTGTPVIDGKLSTNRVCLWSLEFPKTMLIPEKMFGLKAVSPFDHLRDSELALIAEVTREKRYEPGAVVCSEEKPLQRLHIIVEGQILLPSGDPMPPVFGVAALLCDMPVVQTLTVGTEGALCLVINKGNFFTTINECPSLVAGFLELPLGEESVISS